MDTGSAPTPMDSIPRRTRRDSRTTPMHSSSRLACISKPTHGGKENSMKSIKAFPVVAGWTILLGASAFASDVRVIANPSVKADSISARELKSVYLEEKNSVNGTHVEPVIEKRGPAHEAFLHDYLG